MSPLIKRGSTLALSLLLSSSSLMAATQQFDLKANWNLIGSTLDITDPSQFDKSNIKRIWSFDPESGQWYTRPTSSQYGEIVAIPSGYGVFLYAEDDMTLTIEGSEPSSSTLAVKSGWNLSGVKGSDTVGISKLLAYDGGAISRIYVFSTDEQSYVRYEGSDTGAIETTQGYWIKSSKDFTLDFSALSAEELDLPPTPNSSSSSSKSSTSSSSTSSSSNTDCDSEGIEFFPQSIASGDPTTSSVVLWTRAKDADHPSDDLTLTYQVATDKSFNNIIIEDTIIAHSKNYGNVKKKLTGLDAGATYYYRFIYDNDGSNYCTRTGRTKTAPEADADVEVNFIMTSGQDYIGKYWNTYRHAIDLGEEKDFDFIVQTGDYIYETTGDPAFQATGSERSITFDDPSSALVVGKGTSAFKAAYSLSNYYNLYEAYRGDPVIQHLHEQYPWFLVWDDHEYSDDYVDTASAYFDHRDESDPKRKYNSERAYMEWMPLDIGLNSDGELEVPEYTGSKITSTSDRFTLWRNIRWGKNFTGVMVDTRNWRAKHLIPTDAWSGTIVMTKENIEDTFNQYGDELDLYGATKPYTYENTKDKYFGPYVNVDSGDYTKVITTMEECSDYGLYNKTPKQLMIEQLTKQYKAWYDENLAEDPQMANYTTAQKTTLAEEMATKAISGNISAYAAAKLLANHIEDYEPSDITGLADDFGISDDWYEDPEDAWWYLGSDCLGGGWGFPKELFIGSDEYDALPRGLSYNHLGHINLFSSHGVTSRTAIVKQTYDIYSKYKYEIETNHASEDIFGSEQEAFLKDSLSSSDATWRILLSQISHVPMVINPQVARSLDSTLDAAMTAAEVAVAAGSWIDSWYAKQFGAILNYEVYMNLDQWDGFTNKRAEMMKYYDSINEGKNNIVIISGDIHSSWVYTHNADTKIHEFTGASISSGTAKGLLVNKVSNSFFDTFGITDLVLNLAVDKMNALVLDSADGDGYGMEYTNVADNGYMHFTAKKDGFTMSYFFVPYQTTKENYYGAEYGGTTTKEIDDLDFIERVYEIDMNGNRTCTKNCDYTYRSL